MTRYFTQAKLEELLTEIESINKSNWSWFTDLIGDAALHLGKCIKFVSLDDDMSNIKSYHRKVLDMNDTTKAELKAIFDAVKAVDLDCANQVDRLVQPSKCYIAKINQLSEMINPGFSIAPAAEIAAAMTVFNSALAADGATINDLYLKEVNYALKKDALKATKGLVGSLIEGTVNLLTMPVKMVKNIATLNFGGIATDTYSLINSMFSVGDNLAGLTALGMTFLTKDPSRKDDALALAEPHIGTEGLSDVLKNEFGENSVVYKISKGVDTASKTYSFFDSAHDLFDDPKNWVTGKTGFKSKMGELKLPEGAIYNADGIAATYQKLYKDLGSYYHYVTFSNIKTANKYLSNFWKLTDGDGGDVFGGLSNTYFSEASDAYKTGKDFIDLVKDDTIQDLFKDLMNNSGGRHG